jgi:hypothetical protein
VTYFSDEQVSLLLKPIHPRRVRVRDGMSHVEGYDIRAELTRVFGFGRWSSEVLEQAALCERETKTKTYTDKKTGEQKGGHPAWYVVYRSRIRLKVHAPDGTLITFHDGTHVGASTHPDFGEAHGNALTNSETYALRRAAINLGDQFGLSLYNKGSMDAIVRWTLVRPEAAAEASTTDTDDVPQVSAEEPGGASNGSDEEDGGSAFDSAEPPAPKAAEPDPADAGDLWERPWLDVATETAATFKAKADGQKLWREAAAKAHAGECTAADAARIQELITARLEDLAKPAPVSLAAAARLDPGDDWTAKLDEIGDDEEIARRVLAELTEARRMPAAKGHNIRAAITGRFPALGSESSVAA